MDVVERARIFAIAAHAAIKQKRKYTGEPYIIHPEAVVELVKSVPHTPEMLAAAWMHDVVEDTGVESDLIYKEFGAWIGLLVESLTDISRPEDGNRALRKEKDRAFLSMAPREAQTIKLADIIDNAKALKELDPDFYKVWRFEKEDLLKVMDLGDPTLMKMAQEVIGL